jgi:3-dehydroquinate dehydratase
MSRKTQIIGGLVAIFVLLPGAWAHHSFAVYDFGQQIEFAGTVESINFKNPHIAMTLKVTNDNGEAQIIDFIEGAPANMLARKGLRPAMVAVGEEITVFGSPLIEDPSKFFIRRIRLADGSEFD